MFKNQLQELAQRSCFNLPSYSSIREGPDHAPRFKASVNFNGELFESPSYSTTLRHAEHAAAEAALASLSARIPSKTLTARVLDETGIYKNLLQETAHRAGSKLPVYTTVRSGPGHAPVFTSSVEIAGICFTGESAKTKKQAEKNAAVSAWSSLKTMPNLWKNSKELDSYGGNGLIRRRDFQFSRGRMQRVQDQKRPWKFTDPSYENHVQNQKDFDHDFLCLTTPARTILPRDLYSPRTGASAIKTMGSSQVQETRSEPSKMVGNFEGINKISEAIKKSAEGKSVHNKQTESGPSKMAEDSALFNKISSEAMKKPAEGKSVYNNQTGGGQSKMAQNFEFSKISEAIEKPGEAKSVHYNQTGSGQSKMAENFEFNKISEAIKKSGEAKSVYNYQTGGGQSKMGENGAIKKPGEGNSLHNKQTESGALKTVENSEFFNKISEAFRKPYSHFHGGNSKVEEDVNEWINKISEAIKKPAEGKSCPVKFQSSCSNRHQMGGQRFAPAVQIRSVIPVCAAPPPKEAAAAAAEELDSTLTELKL